MKGKTHSRKVTDLIPALQWLAHYDRAWLSADLIAGLSVWALIAPQGIAYSSIVGVPAQFGLYTAMGALIGYALFGTSRQLMTGQHLRDGSPGSADAGRPARNRARGLARPRHRATPHPVSGQ